MLKPIGFWSYTKSDDTSSAGKLSRLRDLVAAEMRQQLGPALQVEIFQDVDAIPTGSEWEKRIRAALAESSFLIPIITPGFFQREWCCREVALFRDLETGLGRADLIFPIHYVNVDHVDGSNPHDCHDREILEFLRTRQWTDFRKLRHRDPQHEDVAVFIEKLVSEICTALRARVPPPAPPPRPSVPEARVALAPRPASPPPPPSATVPLPFWQGGPPPAFASASGRDQFGPWVEFTIQPASGAAVTQRLRWIEPGTFWMGSPEKEPERVEREGPRHRVTLTRGSWLADTACTQALWQAVVAKNPSLFERDAQLPVENVSWHDVQAFLRALEARLPGCRADLPTEAEWEYACRAGTETPFSFGATITPAQVNYDGNYPYAGGTKGLYREETVPVRSLPPNDWGLYEMHGNVWEWCSDGVRVYDGETQLDPRGLGPDEQTVRAVRGGSWYGNAWWARSAYRSGAPPGDAYDALGFRFCLRSS
jgi:formylglycine-generating enzyme required for sulfatase activity